MIATLLFYGFAALTVLSALMVISMKNPVHSVLFLIFAFFNAAGLFILLGAEFLAMLLVIVYVGAVAVLFLFVVMMLDINVSRAREGFMRYVPLGAGVAAIMLFELIVMIRYSVGKEVVTVAQEPIPAGVTNTEALGALIYTHYAYPFQLAGVVLLVAMIGAIVLTLRQRPGVRRQSAAKQIARTRDESIEIIKVQSGKGV
jgi:NADH-quinone oxidoreductase subunit J